jgi:hypothetical protein
MAQEALSLEQLQDRFGKLAELPGQGTAIGTRDAEAGLILRVLEFGSMAGQRPWPRPGPRTVAAVDPETGAEVIVTAQAPQGFIRVQTRTFAEWLQKELQRPANWLDFGAVHALVQSAVKTAATAALERLKNAVPGASGTLPESLIILDEGNGAERESPRKRFLRP